MPAPSPVHAFNTSSSPTQSRALCFIAGGGLYFQEFYNLAIEKYVIFVMGILIVLLGVYGLAPDPPTFEDTDEATRAGIVKRVDAAGRTSISRVGVYTLGHDEAYQ